MRVGREGGRPASATHSFMTSISRRLLGEHMVSFRFRFRFSSRFACFVGRGARRRADGNLGGHGPPQRPKNGRAELPGSRSLGPAGRSRGYVYPAGPASLCCCLVSVKEDLDFFFFFLGGGGCANCTYGAKIRLNQVTLAEWSKAVRSGRIHLLMAWVRIPQVTTYALTIFFWLGCVCGGGRREEGTKPQNLFKKFYYFFHTHSY